jgi:SAM-dependent methyltransferase
MLTFPFPRFAPIFIKRLVWERKRRGRETNASLCPHEFVKFLIPKLRPSAVLLDFGCGEGNLLAALRSHDWQGHYIGVDISESAVRTSKLLHDFNAEWYVSPIETFPLRRADMVCFVESLYYAKNVSELLKRWAHSDMCIRICHTHQHADVIANLRSFQREGVIWYRPSQQTST